MPKQPFDLYEDTQTGNYLGYSRGADAYSAIGTAASGAGNVIKAGAAFADEVIKERIGDEVYSKLDPIRQAAAGALERNELGPIPDEVKAGLDKAGQLKMAKEAGALDESHYWNLLDAEARRLRGQHPGYKDYVDQRVAALTGADPANKLVQKLYDEKQALSNAKATTAEKQFAHWEEKFIMTGRAGDPKTGIMMDTSKMSIEQFKVGVAKHEAQLTANKQRDTEINMAAMEKKNVESKVETAITIENQNVVNNMMNAATNNPAFEALIKSWSKVTTGAAPGGKIDVTDMEDLRTKLGEFETSAKLAMNQNWISKREGNTTYGQYIDVKKREAIDEAAMLPFKIIKDAVLNSDTGTIGAIQNRIKNIDAANVGNLYKDNVFFQRWAAFRDIFGPQALPLIIESAGGVKGIAGAGNAFADPAQKGRLYEGLTDSADPKKALKDTFNSYNDTEGTKPETYTATVNGILEHLRNGNPNGSGFKASARYFFGKGNDNIFGHIDPDTGKISNTFKDPYSLYQKMADPIVAQNMIKIQQSDPDTYKSWSRFVNNNFDFLMYKSATGAQEMINALPSHTVKWNPTALELQVVPRTNAPSRTGLFTGLGGLADPLVSLQGRKAVGEINQALSGLKAMYAAEKKDVSTEITNKVLSLKNLNLSAKLEGNMWDQVTGAFETAKTEAEKPAGGTSNKEKTSTPARKNTTEVPKGSGNSVPETPREPTSKVPITPPERKRLSDYEDGDVISHADGRQFKKVGNKLFQWLDGKTLGQEIDLTTGDVKQQEPRSRVPTSR